jgi:hypothetical protein
MGQDPKVRQLDKLWKKAVKRGDPQADSFRKDVIAAKAEHRKPIGRPKGTVRPRISLPDPIGEAAAAAALAQVAAAAVAAMAQVAAAAAAAAEIVREQHREEEQLRKVEQLREEKEKQYREEEQLRKCQQDREDTLREEKAKLREEKAKLREEEHQRREEQKKLREEIEKRRRIEDKKVIMSYLEKEWIVGDEEPWILPGTPPRARKPAQNLRRDAKAAIQRERVSGMGLWKLLRLAGPEDAEADAEADAAAGAARAAAGAAAAAEAAKHAAGAAEAAEAAKHAAEDAFMRFWKTGRGREKRLLAADEHRRLDLEYQDKKRRLNAEGGP